MDLSLVESIQGSILEHNTRIAIRCGGCACNLGNLFEW